MMQFKLNDLPFLSRVATILSASSVGLVISLLLSIPLLRLYSPAEYGIYATFLAGVNIFSIIGTGQFYHAFFTQDIQEWRSILALIASMTGLTILLSFCVLLILRWFEYTPMSQYIFISFPLALIFSVFQSVLLAIATRTKSLKALALNKIWVSVLPILFSLALRKLLPNEQGLIWGNILGVLASLLILFNSQRIVFPNSSDFSFKRLEFTFLRIKDFFNFTFPAELLNSLANQLPLFILGQITTPAIIGNYKLANKIVSIPSALIANSVSSIYKQDLIPEISKTGHARNLYLKSFNLLSIVGIVFFIVLLTWGKFIIGIVYGSKWETAAYILKLIALLYFAKLVVGPLVYILQVTGNQLFSLKLAVVQIIILAIGFSISFWMKLNWSTTVVIYVLLYTSICIFTFFKCLEIASHSKVKSSLETFQNEYDQA